LSETLGPSMVRQIHLVLAGVLRYAIRDGHLTNKPSEGHTAASLAVSTGAHVKAVQRMLGLASAAMTLDVYADLFEDDLDAVAVALDAGAAK